MFDYKLLFMRYFLATVCIVLLLGSCKKEEHTNVGPAPAGNTSSPANDTIPPVIVISVGNSMNQSLPATIGSGTFTAPVATAYDSVDGDISANIQISSNVNPNVKGHYTCIYSVSDSSGNAAAETLDVYIVNDAEFLAGFYTVADSTQQCNPPSAFFVSVYSDSVIADAFMNNRIHVKKFANYMNATVYLQVASGDILFPVQTLLCGSPAFNHTFSQVNTAPINMNTPIRFMLSYQDAFSNPSPTTSCGFSFYTKQ